MQIIVPVRIFFEALERTLLNISCNAIKKVFKETIASFQNFYFNWITRLPQEITSLCQKENNFLPLLLYITIFFCCLLLLFEMEPLFSGGKQLCLLGLFACLSLWHYKFRKCYITVPTTIESNRLKITCMFWRFIL